jgi:hypothetical protein
LVDYTSYNKNNATKHIRTSIYNFTDGGNKPEKGYYALDEEFIPKKKRYFSSLSYHGVEWNPKLKNGFNLLKGSIYKKSLVEQLNLRAYPKSKWRAIINTILDWYKQEYFDKLPKSSTVTIPDTFEPKVERINYEALRQSEGKVLLKKGRRSSQYYGDTVFDSVDYKIKNLNKIYKLCIYGANQDKKELSKIEPLLRSNKNTEVFMCASKNFKILEQFPNFVHFKKILEMKKSNYPVVEKELTRLYIQEKLSNKKGINNNINIVSWLNKNIAIDYEVVSRFADSNYTRIDDEVKEEWLKFAEDNNLLNTEYTTKLDRVNKFFSKLDFLDLLKTSDSYYSHSKAIIWTDDEEAVKNNPDGTYARMRKLILDLCKLRKLRIDSRHYMKPVEDLTEEIEEVLEETVGSDE